jgi:hypothetical protein
MQIYKVIVATPKGPLHLRRDTALAALKTARVLEREDIDAITITGPEGRKWSPEQLAVELEHQAASLPHRSDRPTARQQ